MASLLKSLVDPRKNWFARQHMKVVSQRLCHYGFRYDNLYDPYYNLDIKEALSHMSKEIVDARNQHLKRTMDLSMKHEYLPEHLQHPTKQEPDDQPKCQLLEELCARARDLA